MKILFTNVILKIDANRNLFLKRHIFPENYYKTSFVPGKHINHYGSQLGDYQANREYNRTPYVIRTILDDAV